MERLNLTNHWNTAVLKKSIDTNVGKVEHFTNIGILFFLSGALLYIFGDEALTENTESKSSIPTIVWTAIYGVVILLTKKNLQSIKQLAIKNKYFIFLSILILLSSIWSQAPEITFRRSISYSACVLYGLYITVRFDKKNIIKLFYHLSLFIALSSLLFVILLPKYGLANGLHEGAWQGVYFHKNGLGRIAGLCLLSSVVYLIENKKQRIISFSVAIICLTLLIQSKSSTALLSTILLIPFAILINWTYTNYNVYKSIFTTMFLIFILYTSVILFNEYSDKLFGEIGKDDSFSGRLPLWALLLVYVEKSPFLGYGYSSFWVPKIISENVWEEATWAPQQGHNGFIDIALQIGVIGLTMFLIILIKGYIRSLKLIKQNNSPSNYWFILVIIYLTIVSFTETFVLKHNNIYWIMLLICCVNVNRENNILRIKKRVYDPKPELYPKVNHTVF